MAPKQPLPVVSWDKVSAFRLARQHLLERVHVRDLNQALEDRGGAQALLAAEHHKKVYRPQGWIAPVVLVNGRIEATWAYTRQAGHLQISVESFGLPLSGFSGMIMEQARDFSRFLGAGNVDVQIA